VGNSNNVARTDRRITALGAVFLKQYRAISLLGRGAIGEVFLARHVAKPEVVVVKVINKDIAQDPAFRPFFDRETQSLATLKHPNIVSFFGSDFNDPNGPCLVMEFIPGITLEKLLERRKRFSIEQVYRLLLPLCRALSYGHSRQITHCDLKPANLMVTDPDTENESLKVMDFGLAQLNSKPHLSLDQLRGIHRVTACGTPTYVAPEVLRGDPIDQRSDFYSVGVMLFELLTGVPPFQNDDVDELFEAHLHNNPPRLVDVCPAINVPPRVELLIRQCLEKYPAERPQGAGEIAIEFARATGLPVPPMEEFEHEDDQELLKTIPGTSPLLPPELAANPKHALIKSFDAWMPEPIAVTKLRGFIEDFDGEIVESEPGRIRAYFGASSSPPTSGTKGVFGWLTTKFRSLPTLVGNQPDPIEMVLYLDRKSRSSSLELTVILKPFDGHRLVHPHEWQPRCQALLSEMKAYFMAR
jgi:serine/threonine protein kinase